MPEKDADAVLEAVRVPETDPDRDALREAEGDETERVYVADGVPVRDAVLERDARETLSERESEIEREWVGTNVGESVSEDLVKDCDVVGVCVALIEVAD